LVKRVRAVYAKATPYKSISMLQIAVPETWATNSQGCLKHSIESIQVRVKTLIEAMGFVTGHW
jgi:hypothetical protein